MATAELLKMTDKKTADKEKALESALAQIERQFGKGSIMKLGGQNQMPDIEATSTGSLGLDIALGIGGLPMGRIIDPLTSMGATIQSMGEKPSSKAGESGCRRK